MGISFSPQRRDDVLSVIKQGDVLTINAQSFDFSSLPDGAVIPAGEVPCDWIVGPVERVEGEIHLTLIAPYRVGNRHVGAPPPLIDPPDGPITMPNLDPAPEPEVEEPDHVDA